MTIKSTLLALALLAVPATAGAVEHYLLAAGNNLGNAGEPPLRYAEHDATVIASILQRLGAIPAQNVVLVRGEDADTFRGVLLELNARIRSRDPDPEGTALTVFYSGHADASGLHLGQSTLPFDELKTILAGSAATVRLLIIDACRSGGLTRVKGAQPAQEFVIRLVDRVRATGVAIITSSSAGEDSYESDALRASFFSHHLANALRGAADSDRDGRVTLDEAYRYTYTQTLRSSGRAVQLQHPTYQYELKGKGDLVLTRLANDRDRSGRLRIGTPGRYVVFEEAEDGLVTAEITVGREGACLVLPAGAYFVQKRDASDYLEYELELEPGQRVALDTLAHRTVKYARLLRKGGGDRVASPGLILLGGFRGGILPGEGVHPHAVLGARLDLPWMTFGLRGRVMRGTGATAGGLTRMTHTEYGLGLTARRYVDFRGFSLSLGLLIEAVRHVQEFSTPGEAPDRSSWSFGFGGLVSTELELSPALAVVCEGGPMTQVFRRALTDAGSVTGQETDSPLTWWAAAGLGWRF